jgi:hypothetical protein
LMLSIAATNSSESWNYSCSRRNPDAKEQDFRHRTLRAHREKT